MTWVTEPKVRQEPEAVSARRAVKIIAAVLVVFAASVLFVWWVLPERLRTLRTDRLPVEPVSRIEQGRFIPTARGIALREEALRRLDEATWVDRERNLARIPVQQALELYLLQPDLRPGEEGGTP
jgi:hypothetical protein